uniref:ATP synthase subunit a n=1 Tax=Myadora brevis TaxID=457650 RepID=A0A1U9XPJ4_9BIVA|nr:ATP synthase F0 subunit 6 [Myadora brevis]AQZ26164.1 ATP synthase subunit 6 [Myadora brevis]
MCTDLFSSFDDQNFNVFPSFIVLFVDFLIPSLFISSFFFHGFKNSPLGLVYLLKSWVWGFVKISNSVRLGGFSLLVSSLFLFIFFNNLMGLFPYVFSWTSHVSLSFSMSVPFWLSLLISSFLWHWGAVLAHCYPGGASLFMMLILVLGETISIFLRPFSLALRLAVNMTAGHVFVGLMSKGVVMGLVFDMSVLLLMVCLMLLIGLFMAEMVVCLIQALVFAMLLTLYGNEHPLVSSFNENDQLSFYFTKLAEKLVIKNL